MRTDDLILALAAGAEPVNVRAVRWRYLTGMGAATSVALLLVIYWMGVRPDFLDRPDLPMFWFKELFCAALVVTGLLAMVRLARPGIRLAWAPALIAVPLLAMWAAGILELLAAEPEDRLPLLLGVSWSECPYNIVVLSLPVFVVAIGLLRRMAPTRLRLAGAAAGFVSGAVGALVYSLHCPELAAAFLSVWYALGMLIPTAVGALLGPRLLRW